MVEYAELELETNATTNTIVMTLQGLDLIGRITRDSHQEQTS